MIAWLCIATVLNGSGRVGFESVQATPASEFLDSIGVNSAIDQRGETLEQTIRFTKYLGIRWFRSGIEGSVSISDLLQLHQQTAAKLSWSPGSGGSDLSKLLDTARQLAKSDALLAFEGPNEPNNWPITYQGKKGGGGESWLPVAAFQSDLYRSVKLDPLLKKYPVWGVSEEGAETDNVGLQFLTVPSGKSYADDANVHNYVYHPNSPGLEDNKTWNACDPSSNCRVDGLYGEVGVTWAHHYAGYSRAALEKLPRVTTETGVAIGGPITEQIHANNLLSLYLDQFKRGWNHTAVYLLRDRVDESGNQQFGFYKPDNTPRLAALYLHNLTTILADSGRMSGGHRIGYSIPDKTPTNHDLLLEKSDRTFYLVVWSERLQGSDVVQVEFASKFPSVQIYDPTVSSNVVRSVSNVDTVHLTLTDHPLVLRISMKG
jgi:hypothetical protein